MKSLQKIRLNAAWLILPATLAWGHGGEDHAHPADAAAKANNAPAVAVATAGDPQRAQRLGDGSVYLPKPMQRQAGLRTAPAVAGRFAKSVELAGRVIGDPASSGHVQATQAGRIEAGRGGLAMVGRRVRAGEVLGLLRPVASSLERGAQLAQVADLQAQLAVAERKLDRAQQLAGLTPQKEIDAAAIEVDGVKARLAALRGGLETAEVLTAPVSGVIAAANVVAGQVVEPREMLFEIIDPQRLAVEALAYDAALVDRVTGGRVVLAGVGSPYDAAGGEPASARLRYLGGARQLREGALPLLFRVEPAAAAAGRPADQGSIGLAVGQSVAVVAETRELVDGVVVPAAAIVRDGQGETQVWIKTAPERFSPRRVPVVPLDAQRVVIGSGIAAGERVVSAGASALAQIR